MILKSFGSESQEPTDHAFKLFNDYTFVVAADWRLKEIFGDVSKTLSLNFEDMTKEILFLAIESFLFSP